MAVEGNASVYQVNYVSRITGEGRAGGERTGGKFVRGSYKSLKGINLMVLGRNIYIYAPQKTARYVLDVKNLLWIAPQGGGIEADRYPERRFQG